MARKAELIKACAYIRTSSAANVGSDKDSEQRQRAAIEAFAKRGGFVLVGLPLYYTHVRTSPERILKGHKAQKPADEARGDAGHTLAARL